MNEEIKTMNKKGFLSIIVLFSLPFIWGKVMDLIPEIFSSPLFWIYLLFVSFLFVIVLTSKIIITDTFIEKKNMFYSSRMDFANIQSVVVQATYYEDAFICSVSLVENLHKKLTIQLAPIFSNKTAIANIFKAITTHVPSVHGNDCLRAIANGDVTEASFMKAATDEALRESFSWKRVFVLLFAILFVIATFIYFAFRAS